MTDILDQDELDVLLTAISTGEAETSETPAPAAVKVRNYDFRRPDKFAKDHIRTLQMMHETFARLTETMLSARIRSQVSVSVVSVDQLTYGEFIRSIPNPATLAVMDMYPLNGSVVFEIDPNITFSIIDRLFGGHGESPVPGRELTDIELYAIDRLLAGITGNLVVTWSNVISIRAMLSCIETDPQFAQIVPPDDMVVLITFEVKIGNTEGMFNLCIPYITLEPVIDRLSAKYWFTSGGEWSNDEMERRLDKAEYMRHIVFRDAVDPMSPEMIRRLKPGTVLPLNDKARAMPRYEFIRTGKEA